MPVRNPSNCSQPMCTKPTYGRWCEAHLKEFNRFKTITYTKEYKHLYKRKAWTNTRLDVLHHEPFCRACAAVGVERVATEVDHVIPHDGNESLFWDRGNLAPLCKSCHSRKTLSETKAKQKGTYHANN